MEAIDKLRDKQREAIDKGDWKLVETIQAEIDILMSEEFIFTTLNK